MKTNYNNLPDELKRLGLFCLWRYEKVNGRLSKIPYSLRGCKASSTDRNSFCSFGTALKVADRYSGIGLGIFDGYCAVDIDHCVADGRLSELALDVINAMNSYTEYSPSGEGVRIIFRADGFKYDKEKFYINNHKIGLEIYVSGSTNKYVTLTGNVIRNVPIAERGDKLTGILNKYMCKNNCQFAVRNSQLNQYSKTSVPPLMTASSTTELSKGGIGCRGSLPDDEVLSKANSAKNGKKFSELWNGNFDKSHSEADLALCSMLAFWCGGDSAQIDRLFRQSGLYREKWERDDYRRETLKKAVQGCDEVYLQRTNASDDFSESLMDKLIEFHPEQNQKYPETDIGAGRLFADIYKDIARYVPERKCWYCYDGGVWKQDVGNLRAMEYLKELADALMGYALKIENEYRRGQYIKFCSKWQKRHNRDVFLRDAQGVYPVSMREFDQNPYIFNCKNGTLHLDTMEFTEHKATDRLTKISDVEYNPEAKCKRFDYFVGEICDGDEDKMNYLQRALGYGLSGDTRHECLFILYGATTRNGKGTLCESVLGVLGDYGCTSRPETISTNLNRHSNSPSEDIARLAGKRFVNISEPSKGLNLDAAKLKAMTGNDSLNARFLNENSFDFKPQFKIYINTNYLPVVTDMTLFTSNRIITIPFERHFDEDEQDKTLKAEFAKPENKSAILNWLIEGFLLQRKEGLAMPFAVQKATESYQNDSDKIRCFAEDCLIPDADGECKTADVYSRYKEWCSDNGYYPEGMRTFKQGLLTFAEIKKKRPNSGGNPTPLLMGYKLTCEFKEYNL